MLNYFIEFGLVHIVLLVIYRLLLQKETQLSIRRAYLLGSVLLAAVIPFVKLPVTPLQSIDITSSISSIVLPEVSITGSQIEQHAYTQLSWFEWLFSVVAILVAIRIILGLVRIGRLYVQSQPFYIDSTKIRHLRGLDSIFTFFSWIFMDKRIISKSREILRHEEAHVKFGHSYDLLLMNILTIPFWWLPTIWATILELKQVHEYQADSYASQGTSEDQYSKTLINYTLSNHGLSLANSFNDTELTKRLKFMKQQKRNVSAWKMASIILIVALTTYTFSCQENAAEEFNMQAETAAITGKIYDKVDVMPEYPGGITEYYTYLMENIKYSEEAQKSGIAGKVLVEMVINKDGSVSEVKVLRGVGYGLDEEAIRVVEGSPNWNPGKLDNEPVRVKMVVPIGFKLTDTNQNTAKSMEEMPTFPGGKEALFHSIQTNLKYPEGAKKAGIEGKVFIEFTVDSDGSVKNVIVKRGVDQLLDEEAKRIVENLPDWTPPLVDGKAVATIMVLPISFKLN